MLHPNFCIENENLAKLHKDAATFANTNEPLGPFVGRWWEMYIAEVIRQAQEEMLAVAKRTADETNGELVAEIERLKQLIAFEIDARKQAEDDLRKATADVNVVNAVIEAETPRVETPAASGSFIIDSAKGVDVFNPFKKG